MNNIFASMVVSQQDRAVSFNVSGRVHMQRDDDLLLFGLDNNSDLLQLDDVRAVMRWAVRSDLARDHDLVWRFSSVSMKLSEVDGAIARWDETGEPPVLSFIGLDLCDHRHMTRGMAAFISHELAAEFGDAALARDAAGGLVRLARYALMQGGLSRAVSFAAADGTDLRLIWPSEGSIGNVVTIDFRSVRNGPSSG